jgi:ribonuclease T2
VPFHPLQVLTSLALASVIASAEPAAAGDRAGDFDLYVLSLSWTPAACASGQADGAECAKPRGLLVHGFWPEYEAGYPQYCDTREPTYVERSILDSVADVMPSRGLAGYEWRKHGVCAGISAVDYFALLRKAAKKVQTPTLLAPGNIPGRTTPAKVEVAFVQANAGLTTQGMSVRCASNTLTEVRICFTKDLDFRSCEDVNNDTCHAASISVTPIQ